MTTARRTTIDLGDILAVEIECDKCHHRIVRPANSIWQKDLFTCPGCGNTWTSYQDILNELRDSILSLRRVSDVLQSERKVPFDVRLEVSEDDREAGA